MHNLDFRVLPDVLIERLVEIHSKSLDLAVTVDTDGRYTTFEGKLVPPIAAFGNGNQNTIPYQQTITIKKSVGGDTIDFFANKIRFIEVKIPTQDLKANSTWKLIYKD